MAITHREVSIRNVQSLAGTMNYINILQPVNFNVFLHGSFLQCACHKSKMIIEKRPLQLFKNKNH